MKQLCVATVTEVLVQCVLHIVETIEDSLREVADELKNSLVHFGGDLRNCSASDNVSQVNVARIILSQFRVFLNLLTLILCPSSFPNGGV